MFRTRSLVSLVLAWDACLGIWNLAHAENAEKDAGSLLCELTKSATRPMGAPPLDAVCFSSRWAHPQNANDPHDTFSTAAAFDATDFVWIYSLDAKFVGRMKQAGGKVYLAINSLVPDAPGSNERLRGRILDLDGNRVSAPWMRGWKGSYWGCANSPEYRASYVAFANRAIDAGSDGLQMDDPLMNVAAVNWGGCFCPHCMAGFRRYLQEHATADELAKWDIPDVTQFDYREYLKARHAPVGDAFAKYDGGALKRHFAAFQEQSVRAFFQDTRAQIDAHAGRHVVFSSNNYAGRWQFPYELFEFGMAELPERDANPKTIYQRLAEARRQGKAQLLTLVPKALDGSEVGPTRRAIAMCYAGGGHLIVPWDVYTGSDRPRYYGQPEQYADLYRFVRGQRQLFAGYEDAAFVLPDASDGRYPTDPPLAVSDANVAAIARVQPGKPDAPAVIHLVDWRSEPQPFTVTIASRRFSRSGELRAELLQPGQPAQRLDGHGGDSQMEFKIPQLSPWGLLVVTPAERPH